jgi:biotin carboxyl carrier protein
MKAIINNHEYDIVPADGGMNVNGVEMKPDILELSSQKMHILLNNKSYGVELASMDIAQKEMTIKVNGSLYQVKLKDRYDELLHQLGMDAKVGKKTNEIKAPMPGMVLRMMVKQGDTIAKGDGLLVLEAMKMENIIKAPADGVIKQLMVAERDKVEKNQVMIQLD